MTVPVAYNHGVALAFGGCAPAKPFDACPAVILPVPLERTTSYVPGTRNAPHDILLASSHLELWDEEMDLDAHARGIFTLPEMELPLGEMAEAMAEITRVATALAATGKFLVTLGGEHSITPAVVAAFAERHAELSVLQIDAHADLRDAFMGSRFTHACAMRRVLEHAPCTQVAIRSLSTEETEAIPRLATRIFYDFDMRHDPTWIDRVVDTLSGDVYVTIDCDGLDPAVMPAVGTPEPGGVSWYELLTLLRATFARRNVVACDVVELCPLPGLVAPTFLCAKLAYKLFAYHTAFTR